VPSGRLNAASFLVSVPPRSLTKTTSSIKGTFLMTNIFVGNLSFQTTQDELHAAFAQYGAVERVNIVTDRDTGQPRGFAFVEMTDRSAAETAISQLNGADMNGRALNVNEARPKPQGGGGGGYGGNRGGGGGGRGRGSRW
jgi:RNA recognition motif-containing protein